VSKLYLVGVTEDRTGLVLAKSPRAKKGESVLMRVIRESRAFYVVLKTESKE